MDIYVYDNLTTYEKRNPTKEENMEIDIYKTMITPNKGFWFFTHFKREETHTNVNKPYMHWHDGIASINKMQFDEAPYIISKEQWKYNPKNGFLEANPSFISYWNGKKYRFSKPIFYKKVTYYGIKLPKKRTPCTGIWYYDLKFHRINIILNYYPAQKNFEMETKPDFNALRKRLDILESSSSDTF